MAKNPNKKAKALQKDEQMNGAMKFFLAGCVAELYLLIIRRFYINADSELSRIAWYDRYLWMLAGIGAGVLAVGLIAALTAKANAGRRKTGWALAGAGAFVGIASALVRWNMATLSLMTIVVPVVILLGVLWALYDRECALALTVLGVALLALWGYRRYASSMYVGTAVKALVALYLVALIVLAYSLFRSYSKNIAARDRENATFERIVEKPRKQLSLMRKKWTNRKTARYFKCKGCGQVLSVPRGKGTLRVVCPKCKTETKLKS